MPIIVNHFAPLFSKKLAKRFTKFSRKKGNNKKSQTTRNYTNKKKYKYIKIYNTASYGKNLKGYRCKTSNK